MNRLILASGSPRRKELLKQAQLSFQVETSLIDEVMDNSLTPSELVQQLAFDKAKDVFSRNKDAIVIGADTIVAYDGKMLGKPKNDKDAIEMLSNLSGNTHSVFTGVAILCEDEELKFYEETKVTFWKLTKEEINKYVASNEPHDKAGAYGIQGLGATLVKRIEGDYFNVVGLPLSKVTRELRRFL